ncbi:hypothetical protein CCACVL1_25184 [Corchorus capsularis]|uniref:F-box domain-containing protein n=1 Tax=Corchorus capsularis TaxID=210143 RepID=A0A1R3GLR7_COCAP|nr:hypothetical protein CCACVL1_25184 [Corchorus capsularis]
MAESCVESDSGAAFIFFLGSTGKNVIPSKLEIKDMTDQYQSQLLEEICMEILERLSVKSLIRFKSVCKSWKSLISTPYFMDRHFDRNAANSNKLGIVEMIQVARYNSFYIQTLNFSPTSLGETSIIDQSLEECNDAKVLGWCRGLLLVGVDCSDYKLLLWNPSTSKCKEISDPQYQQLEYEYIDSSTLGYDFNIKSHKIVLIYKLGKFERCISVYTLKTNSWTSVELDTEHKVADYDGYPITLTANGAPHWVINHRDVVTRPESEYNITHRRIEYFDFGVNKLLVVQQPGDYDNCRFAVTPQLYDTEGSLCIGYRKGGFILEIWVMKRYGVKDSWFKWMSYEDEYVPFPICFAKNNINVSFFVGRGKKCCAIYNGKEKGIELEGMGELVSELREMGSLVFHEFKKQASFFFKEKFKTARLALTDVTPVELLTEEATNGNMLSPNASSMSAISRAAFEVDDYWRIVDILHKRLSKFDTKNWRASYNALVLLEHLLTHENEAFLKEERARARKLTMGIKGFGSFSQLSSPRDGRFDSQLFYEDHQNEKENNFLEFKENFSSKEEIKITEENQNKEMKSKSSGINGGIESEREHPFCEDEQETAESLISSIM